jgi:hypothetical protein
VGSLSPTFVSARRVGLAVKLPYAFTLEGGFPFHLREPLGASVTLLEATAPVKLPACHGSHTGFTVQVRVKTLSGWYFTVGSIKASALTSQPPSYPTQTAS